FRPTVQAIESPIRKRVGFFYEIVVRGKSSILIRDFEFPWQILPIKKATLNSMSGGRYHLQTAITPFAL
ncbi:MAG: hypothetical protein WD361_11825, partial [Gracilimonas sp.]